MAVGSAGQSPFGGHAGRVLAVAFRPGGLFVATGGGDGTIRVWDVGTGEQRIQLEGHTGPVRSVAYSPDGRVIASAGDDWTVGVWDADTGDQRAQLTGHTGPVGSVVYNRRGDWIASASADRTVRIWDADTGEQLRHLTPRPGALNAVAFSPDGELIACAGNDPAVWIWRIRASPDPERRLTGHVSRVNAVTFSPDGGLIASAGADRSIKIWDPQTGEMRFELSGALATVNAVAFGPGGQAIASAGDNGKVLIWDLASRKSRELADLKARVNCVAYNPAAPAVVATASDDGTARVWEVASRTELHQLKGHTGPITLVAYSPDGNAIATAGADRQVRIWDSGTGDGRTPQLSNGRQVTAMAYSPRRASAMMVTVDEGATVRIWDLTNGRYQQPEPGHEDSISAIAFKLDGSAFATASDDRTILIRDAATGRPVKRLRGHRGPVSSVAYRADGTIVSGGRDGTVRVWKTGSEQPQDADAGTDQPEEVFAGFFGEVRSVACSLAADSAAIAAASGDGTILVWDVGTREQLARLESHGGPVYSMAYDPTGSVIAAACSDGTVKMWDASTFAQRPQLTGHTSAVRSLAFSPDGTRIATCGYDGTIRVWDARTGEQVAGSGFGVPRARRLPLPGVRSDSPSDVDRIGIERDVETLAALIAAKDTSAPLAIALIGEWGAGKSSLMRLVDARVGQLADGSANNRSATAFATSVCPIHFNAWHYSSGHLWASLARAMFQALSLPDGQESGAEIGSDPEKLRAELDKRRRELAEFQRADEQLASELEKARGAEPPSGVFRPLGSPAGLARTLASAYREALGDVKTSWAALLFWLALAAAFACALVFLRHQLRLVSGLVIGAVAVLQPAVRQLQRMWRWHQQLIATTENLDKELRQKKSDLEQETIKAQQRLALVDAQYRFIEFVQAQGNSAIYREGRGLVGDVHDNLVMLSDKLRQARRQWTVEDAQPEPPERIVLYIDDLDRCPPDRVVEMLEAVNLILTLDMFIVVVAVDARWMIRSLECHYHEFFGGAGGAIAADPERPAPDRDRIAPYDYLDKIFQIPYTLVAPRNAESARYLRSLLPEPRLAAGSGAIAPQHDDAGPDHGQEASVPQADRGISPAAAEDQGIAETASVDQAVAEPASVDQAAESRTVLDLQPPSLWLSHAEVEFMTRLGTLTPSPRAAKRMANLYRLVRISIPDEELAAFLGDANGGPYRVVQVLIAILTGAPGIAHELFQRISGAGEGDTLLAALGPHPGQPREDWNIMADIGIKLKRLSDETGLPLEISEYRSWCPDLARYSFRTWRLARELAAREDNSTQSRIAPAVSSPTGGG
jgi:WD40 repeat protein